MIAGHPMPRRVTARLATLGEVSKGRTASTARNHSRQGWVRLLHTTHLVRRLRCARWLRLWLLGLLLVAIPAAAERIPRFHLATPELQARFGRNPQVGRNLDAVAEYRRSSGRTGGTAFLVSPPDRNGVALVLTNHHVALFDKSTVEGDQLLFHPGGAWRPTAARVLGCLAADQEMDYALLSVKLPRSLRELAPVRLSRQGDRGVRAVYNAGFPRIWKAERERAARKQPSLVAVSAQNRPAFRSALAARKLTPKMVQVGTVNTAMWVEPFITLRLANEVGSSGSPVFAKKGDGALAILSAGGGNSDAFARPLGPILDKIATQRAAIADPVLRLAVDRLLLTSQVAGPGR
jgi:hypothetical protein